MSLKGGAQTDRHTDVEKSTYGRRNDIKPRGIDNSSYDGSDGDDSYRRKPQTSERRDDGSREFARTAPYSRLGNLDSRARGHSPPDHRRPSPPYRRSQPDKKYRADSLSSIDDKDSNKRDSRGSPLAKDENHRDSSPNRGRGHSRPPYDERGRGHSRPSYDDIGRDYSRPSYDERGRDYSRPSYDDRGRDYSRPSYDDRGRDYSRPSYDDRGRNRRYSPPDKHRGESGSPSQRYKDSGDTSSNNPNNRRRDPPRNHRARDSPTDRSRNRRARDSSSDRSGDSLDASPNRRNERNRSSLPKNTNRNVAENPLDRHEGTWDTPNKNLFNPKDKQLDKFHDTNRHGSPPNKTRKVENARSNAREPQNGGQQSHHNRDNLGMPDGEKKQAKGEDNTAYPSQDPRGIADQPADVGQDEAKLVYGQDENEERGNWSGKFDFILSMLGYAVGLGNVWRFPYLCYRNGGGAFLFPFLFMMVSIGLPVFYLEAALGQFTSCGAMTCWHFAPLFKGLGIAMVAVSGMTSIYYNMIIGWSLHYMFSSFTSNLPFASCSNQWNTENCKLKLPVMACEGDAKADDGRCLDAGGKETGLWNKTLFTEATGRTLQSPSQEYWERFVLSFSDGIEHYGQPKWDLVLCLLLAWVICFLCLIKGIKTTGKVVYFTALFPYVVLVILLLRGVTLENADIGIKYFIVPSFERLADAGVWKDAANQVFFSMSIAGGGLITLSSYNRFHNNILRDSVIVAVGDAGTCILGGFVIFSYLGYMAGQLQVGIEDVAADGAGLAFVVYPEAVSNLPPPTLWAILFFVMLLTLGLDSQFAMVETVLTGTLDQYPKCRPRKTLVILVICIIFFICGLPLTCPGGMYLLQLMDNYVGGMTLIVIGFIEIIAIVFIYGVNRFCQDIHIMTGSSRFFFWKVTWRVLSPLVIAFIFIFMFVDYKPSMYDKYTYPIWADVLGWFMTIMCVLAIPVVMVFKICKEKEGKTLWQKLRLLCLPTVYWGPSLKKHRILVSYVDGFQVDPFKGLETRNCFVNDAFDKTPETITKSDSQASLGVSRISIISTTSKSTAATAKSGMTYESNV